MLNLWSLPPEEVYERLGSGPAGLEIGEAARRLEQYGPNELPAPEARSLALRLLDQVTHLMAVLLWLAGALAFLAGMPELGWAIWAVVVINAVFSFWQNYRAERALDSLRRVLPQKVRVLRQGFPRVIAARELVPGDLMVLEEGDRVCADSRLVWAESLQLDVSVLTGESMPVAREALAAEPRALVPVRAGQPLQAGESPTRERVHPAEIRNLVLSGSSVVAGRGQAIAYATGARTEFGQVARLTTSVARERSSLELQIDELVRRLTFLSLGIGLLVFALAYQVVGLGLLESALFAIGIIVANVPEGFLPTVTLSLAVAVQRMARRQALVRRLSAVETLSATTVICTDKTGTLTQGCMALESLWLPAAGEVERADPLLTGAVLASNARLVDQVAIGDPTEVALLEAAQRLGLEIAASRLREAPFDSRRRLMSVVVEGLRLGLPPAPQLALTKGAPLEVLRRCNRVLLEEGVVVLQADARARIESAAAELSERALRVLALAARPGEGLDQLTPQALEQELVFMGLLGLHDPPRSEVPGAIERCHRAGLRITMVTGDAGPTARAIARQIGLEPGRTLTGDELEHLSQAQLLALLHSVPELLFARVLPEQKLRLVRAYQELGEVVAVTGDGVNDAPALKAANIGIAMGRKGTDVAREASDVVLTDDNFATLVSAIEEGRTVYANIRKFLTYVLSSNVPEMLPFLFMVGLKIPPALNILQILAVDLGTDMVPALALGSEPPEPDQMDRPPRPREQAMLDGKLLLRTYAFLGMLEGAAAMLAFAAVWWSHGYGLSELQAVTSSLLQHTAPRELELVLRQSTTLALATIIACQLGNVLACRSESRIGGAWWRNRLLLAGMALEGLALLALTHLPGWQRVFQTAPLSGWQWLSLLIWPPVMVLADAAAKRLRLI